MKQKRLLWLAVLVVMLFATYFGMTALTQKDEAKQLEEQTVRVLKGNVNAITASFGDGWSLVSKADTWQWTQDAQFPLTQSYPQAMAAVGEGVKVSGKVLEDFATANPADYGLDTPQNSVTLKTDAGDEMTLTFGDKNAQTNEIYCTVSGDNALYTVSESLALTFAQELYDMITLEKWPVAVATQITSVSVARRGGQALRLDVAVAENGEKTYTVSENGTATAANADMAMGLLEDVAGMYVDGCMNYKADNAELEEYGLQTPDATIVVTWTDVEEKEQSVTLYVGMGTDAANYFTRMEGSSAVNSMEGTALANILNATATNLQAASAVA